jgi:DNA glycosylase AlkZ-like
VSTSESQAAARPDDLAVTAERCAAQLLGGDPAGSAEEVAGRLLAIQAQDLRGARLTVRARSAGLSASDVDAALSQRRSLIVTWLNRGTLHLVRSEDYWWLHPLTTPQLRTGNSRRLAQEGVPPEDAERAVATVQAALATDGPLTRFQLRERVAAAGVRTEGQAMVHILALASIRGLIVRGPVAGRDQAFVLARDWLGTPPPGMSREAALGELARRYLAGHAPAADRDLAQWAGIGLRDARLGLARSARSSEQTAWPSCHPTLSARLPRCRRHGCWARSSRCCWAGLPGTLSSARTGGSSRSTGCSGRSRWPAAGPWRPGTSRAAKSCSHRSRRWTPRPKRR